MNPDASAPATPTPAWQPLSPLERRVLGVLIEKAKTTPDAYPLSLNAIRTACNQKNNRSPVMDVDEAAVQEAVDALREKGAIIEVQGGGRVPRYRHLGYEWLGVDKREVAVMTELLLRGPQTLGELRGRAARMEDIADLAALQPLVDSLKTKQLLLALTPEGRGQVVTHGLYPPEELKQIQREYGAAAGVKPQTPQELPLPGTATPIATKPATARHDPQTPGRLTASTAAAAEVAVTQQLSQLRDEIANVRSQIAQLRDSLDSTRSAFQQQIDELLRFKQALE